MMFMFDALTVSVLTVSVFDNSGNPLELVSKGLAFVTLSCMKVLLARFQDQDQKKHWIQIVSIKIKWKIYLMERDALWKGLFLG